MNMPLARRRPPELYTLFSKDVRIDVLVGPPRVAAVERYVRAAFEREREPSRLDEGHYVHFFPARVRISFIAEPERVLDMQPREIRVEHTRELDSPPPERVRDVAVEVVEAFVDKHPNRHRGYVDYDPASHGVDVTWDAPTSRHMLAPARTPRGPGQMPPRPVRFRIHLLLREAANETGLRAASAQDKADALAREWRLSDTQLRAIEAEFQGTGTVHRGEASRSLLSGGREDDRPQLPTSGPRSGEKRGGSLGPGPKRDPRLRRKRRGQSKEWRRDPQMRHDEIATLAERLELSGALDDAAAAFEVAADAAEEAEAPGLSANLRRRGWQNLVLAWARRRWPHEDIVHADVSRPLDLGNDAARPTTFTIRRKRVRRPFSWISVGRNGQIRLLSGR